MALQEPKFLQIYFISDSNVQAHHRCNAVLNTNFDIVLSLQEMLHHENSYIRSFKCALENITPEYSIIICADKTLTGEHPRRFNAPISSEVPLIMSGEQHGNQYIVLQQRNKTLKRIAETHRSYDPLQYPLIFWQGDDGYHFQLRQQNPARGIPTTKKISAMNFYAYRIMFRSTHFNLILRCKELFLQFAVDMYAKIDAERLRQIALNQQKLCAENYVHLRDAILGDGDATNVGQLVILPSTFTSGPRYMHERTQDAMTYTHNYGRPHLFITFTCNPTWREIADELFPHQKPHDRPDLLARVFHLN